MGARNQVGIGLPYRPASLCSLATQFQTRFLESIPCSIVGLKFSTLYDKKTCATVRPIMFRSDISTNITLICTIVQHATGVNNTDINITHVINTLVV
jgi:hypothetical protein